MALNKVYLWDPLTEVVANGALPDIKYIGSPPGLPITVNPRTEEVEMSDKSRRVAFFAGDKREFTLGWGYLTKAELTTIQGRLALKVLLAYRNEFEELNPGAGPAETYTVYIVSLSYEFVRTGIRDLQRFRAEMTLRQI
ncbi:MAG: hypothetical protein V3W19_17775 [Desulfatiglandales bacterium]